MPEEPHDDFLCKCGFDPFDEVETGPACNCKCHNCQQARESVMYHWRLAKLIDKLEDMDIRLDDLVSLVWREIESGIEERIEKVSRQEMRRALQDVRLVSAVQWSTIKD